jgi:hypothetical protein
MEVAWEAFEQGGLDPNSFRGSATGILVGIGGTDYSRIPVAFDDYFERINAHSGTGNALSIAANRAHVFSLEDGLRLIAERARLMQQLPRDGMMAVVFASGPAVEGLLAGHQEAISIAACNGPENTVISGRSEVVGQLMESCQSQGIRTQALNVSHAFHSPLMEPMLDEFQRFAEQIEYHPPETPIISNLTGDILTEKTPDASYWREHVRNSPEFHYAARVEKPDCNCPNDARSWITRPTPRRAIESLPSIPEARGPWPPWRDSPPDGRRCRCRRSSYGSEGAIAYTAESTRRDSCFREGVHPISLASRCRSTPRAESRHPDPRERCRLE